MESREVALLRRVYADIINGYTLCTLNKKKFYVKHLSSIDQGLIDSEFLRYYDLAILKGIRSEKAATEQAYKNDSWTEEDEYFLETQPRFLDNLLKTKKSLFLHEDITRINSQIDSATAKIIDKKLKKAQAIGFTAELYASKKINEQYIFLTHFRDYSLNVPLFSEEDIYYIDDDELTVYVENYNKLTAEIVNESVRKIALQDFFQSFFGLANDSVYEFYGKPVSQLSFYQTQLASYGRFFREILSKGGIPDDIKSDPDKLIDWHTSSENADKVINRTDKANVAIIGATDKDIKEGATSKQFQSFYDKVRGKKTLSASELMNLNK